jgi:leader peptidase (prepilin peptidase) / N-methyltransferase
MTTLLAGYAFFLGAIIGSFLNVVIHRYPRGQSIVFPPSSCPHCGERIRAYDNIPVVSFLVLRGRCRRCHGPISVRYPLVELANGLFFLAIYLRTGLSVGFIPLAAVVSMTLVLMYIDAEIQILPDVIDIPGIGIGLLIGGASLGLAYPDLVLSTSLTDSLAGAAAGAGVLLAISFAYRFIRKIEGMGLGDVKMLAMLGACCGWRSIFAILLIASVSGALIGVGVMIATRRSNLQFALPFGVFLGIAFLITIFFGRTLGDWLPALALGT